MQISQSTINRLLALLIPSLLLIACQTAAAESQPPSAVPSPTPEPTVTSEPTASAAPEISSLSMIAVGDVMLARTVNRQMITYEDWNWPYLETADILQEADLTIGNLETPITETCIPDDLSQVFCADTRSVDGLVWAGFDALSLANNHTMDRGEEGFQTTLDYLVAAEIAPIFESDYIYRDEINGINLAIVGFDDVNAARDFEPTLDLVEALDRRHDVVIGMLHWGFEYHPTANPRQEAFGRALVDAGMDVVIGHHPHWIQPYEEYNDGLIFYSLGNFVFDQMWSQQTRQGHILDLVITKEDDEIHYDYELIPVVIYLYGQPRVEEFSSN
ncbi:MAG: CapA family protein [Chloroflexi bacterium]|nr:CapA family protein [Chloroflexota bacterium]